MEAHRDVYEKEIEAFGTVFTWVSLQKIGTSAVQSRATGGVANGTYLFALPGSPSACRDAWDESSARNSTTGTGPAISSRSCPGWTKPAQEMSAGRDGARSRTVEDRVIWHGLSGAMYQGDFEDHE